MKKFKERKIKKETKLLLITVLIIGILLLYPILFLGKNPIFTTHVDIPVLNNLSSEKKLTTSSFIKENYITDYTDLIYEKLIEKYPNTFVDILINSETKYYFDKTNLIIIYNNNKVLDTEREFKLIIPYDEIKDYLKFTYDNEDQNIYTNLYEEKNTNLYASITYDDGPNGQRTETLLELLNDYNYSATFFLVANKIASDEQTVKDLAESQNEIGYHSYAHKYLTKQKTSEITEEYTKSDEILYNLTGLHFNLTRPPYGSYNDKVMAAIQTPFIRWNLDTNDWRYKDSEYLSNYVIDNIKDGDIVLFHDSYDTSIEASKIVYEKLYLKGYNLVTVSKLAEIKGITMENNNAYYSFN